VKTLGNLVLAAALVVGFYYLEKKEPEASSRPTGLPTDLRVSTEALDALAQITPSKVVLFSADWCPNCKQVKKLLDKQGVRFTELDVERDPRSAAFQQEHLQIRGFPVLVAGERIIGGYDEPTILSALKEL
jgi:glutaredoxin 3